MADNQNTAPPGAMGGRRKDGREFSAGNMREDGNYVVGKYRPPEPHQFRCGDGRKRGQRPKGVRNHDSEFQEELNRTIVVRENGKERRVSKGRAADIKLIENGLKGQNRAIELIDQRRQRIAEKAAEASQQTLESAAQLLEAWFEQKLADRQIDPATWGDPSPDEPGDRQGKADGD